MLASLLLCFSDHTLAFAPRPVALVAPQATGRSFRLKMSAEEEAAKLRAQAAAARAEAARLAKVW